MPLAIRGEMLRDLPGTTPDGLREAVASLDRRIVSLETRMDQRFATIDDRFTRLEDRMFRQFVWTIGVQVTMFVMMTATLLSAILMQR